MVIVPPDAGGCEAEPRVIVVGTLIVVGTVTWARTVFASAGAAETAAATMEGV